jgi:glycine cleavage system aminomethyltransferase T
VLLDRGVLRAHQKVITAQGDGEITSGSFSPTMQQSIALARLPLAVAIGDDGPGRRFATSGSSGPGRQTLLFVRNGNILV